MTTTFFCFCESLIRRPEYSLKKQVPCGVFEIRHQRHFGDIEGRRPIIALLQVVNSKIFRIKMIRFRSLIRRATSKGQILMAK